MLDGLEELILKIPDEFIYTLLDEYIFASKEEACPQIIVAIRKPIFATSPELQTEIKEWEGVGLKVYELCDWGKEQQEQYFYKNLDTSKLNQNEIENFIGDVNNSDILQKVCNVPYYCSLIADLKNNYEMSTFGDDCDLIDYAIEKLCEREFKKGLDREIVPVDTQKELFVNLAEESFKGNRISKELVMELSEILLDNITKDIRENQLECLKRHAMLTDSGGEIDFVHDILKQYFTGIFLLNKLKHKNVEIFEKEKIEMDSITAKNLLKNAPEIDWNEIMGRTTMLSASPTDNAVGFLNIMGILLSSNIPESEKEKLIKNNLQNKNLTSLVFKNLNLMNFQFQNSKLHDVQFINCDLKNVNFNSCHFKNTFFDSQCSMEGATTKGAMLELIKSEDKILDDQKEIVKWLFQKTQVPSEPRGPCQAVINLSKILHKIILKGRGYKMPKRFLTQTRCGGGIPADKCVEACIKYGFFSEIGDNVRIRVDKFEELVQFVKNQEVSAQMLNLLDDICPDKNIGCQHVYKE